MEEDLPSEPEYLDRNPVTVYSEHQPLADWNNESIGSFGRSAQATYLLSRVFESMKIDDPKIRQEMLSTIDVNLQQLLGIVMKQCRGTWSPYCGSNAIIIK